MHEHALEAAKSSRTVGSIFLVTIDVDEAHPTGCHSLPSPPSRPFPLPLATRKKPRTFAELLQGTRTTRTETLGKRFLSTGQWAVWLPKKDGHGLQNSESISRVIIASPTATARLIDMGLQCLANCESEVILVSHHHPLPTRKRQHENRCRGVSSLYPRVPPRTGFHFRALLSLLVAFLSCSSLAAPVSAHGDRPVLLVQDDLAWEGSPLHFDVNPPPIAPLLLMPPIQSGDDVTSALSVRPSKRSIDTDSNSAGTDFNVPKAFDTGLSNNFTNSCANFLSRLRASDDFNNCHPFSLLLQVSAFLLSAKEHTY
jgi:hypothetical protein